MRWTERDDIRK